MRGFYFQQDLYHLVLEPANYHIKYMIGRMHFVEYRIEWITTLWSRHGEGDLCYDPNLANWFSIVSSTQDLYH